MKILKFTKSLFFILGMAFVVAACGGKRDKVEIYIENAKPDEAKLDTVSYALGVDVAGGMTQQMQNVKLNNDVLISAIKSALNNENSVSAGGETVSFENGEEIINEFYSNVTERDAKLNSGVAADSLGFDANTMFASEDEQDKVSAAFGVMVGTNLQTFPTAISFASFEKGFKDCVAETTVMSADECNNFIMNYMRNVLPERNKEISKVWIEKIAKVQGVGKKSIEDAEILYFVLNEGDKSVAPAQSTDSIKMHYRIIAPTGKIMESSRYAEMPKNMQVQMKRMNPEGYDKNEPIAVTFAALERVIGLKEALALVGKGGSAIVWVPAELTGNEALRFEVELVDVVADESKKKAQEWLSSVEKEAGVQKTASGLLYKIENEGDVNVKAVSDADTVKVHYKGTTSNGNVFDASRFADMPEARQAMMKQYYPEDYDKDEPVSFPLNGVIKGWTEGMKLVGKGGKITLWIPSELAYGERGAGRDIGPNEALRFDIELIDVLPVK